VLVEILNPDGSMARRPELEVFAREHGLKIGSIEDLIRHRLATEHTVERVDVREIDTEHGPSAAHLSRPPEPCAALRAVARRSRRAHADAGARARSRIRWPTPLHWRRPDFGPAVGDVLAGIAREGRGALVLLGEAQDAEACWRASANSPPAPAGRAGALAEWRRNGAGAQILADLGLGKLRVLGTPRKQVGLAGFGLEVVAHVEWPAPLNCGPAG
jgi:3,4-dihydroxy 2-butanone 4-phosphate synthase/GTP cyclohydrolase II